MISRLLVLAMRPHWSLQLTLSISSAASLTRIEVILLSSAAAMGGPCEASISSYQATGKHYQSDFLGPPRICSRIPPKSLFRVRYQEPGLIAFLEPG